MALGETDELDEQIIVVSVNVKHCITEETVIWCSKAHSI